MRRPHLGGHEQFVALDAGGPYAIPDLALVLIDLRGVDVAIAKLERLLHQARAGSSPQLPGAEPDRRDFCATGLYELHDGLSWKTSETETAAASALCPAEAALPIIYAWIVSPRDTVGFRLRPAA
jgi:hypothetical protein